MLNKDNEPKVRGHNLRRTHTLCLSTCVSQDANNMKTEVGELRLLAEGQF